MIASVFAAVSVSPLAGPRAPTVLRWRRVLLGGLRGAHGRSGRRVSLAGLPPLDGPPPAEEGVGPADGARGRLGRALRASRRGGTSSCIGARRSLVPLDGRRGVRAARRGDGRRGAQPQLAPQLVGVAPADAPRVRRDRARRAQRVPPERLAVGGVRRAVPRGDAGPHRPLACGRDRRGRRGGRARRVHRTGCSPSCGARAPPATRSQLLVQAARELRRLDASFRPYLPSVVAQRIRRRADRRPRGSAARSGR